MSRTIRFIASVGFVIGIAVLLSPQSAQARRPSTVASKSYSSGKFIGQLNRDKAANSIQLVEYNTLADASTDTTAEAAIDAATDTAAISASGESAPQSETEYHATAPHVLKPLARHVRFDTLRLELRR